MKALSIQLMFIMLVLVFLTGCGAGPSAHELRDILQRTIDEEFRTDLFEVTWFRRMGTHRLSPTNSEPGRLIVYFDAHLEFLRDYSVSDWDALGLESLLRIIGAGTQGVRGIRSEGNEEGDELLIRGTLFFERDASGAWVSTASRAVSAVDDEAGIEPQYDDVRAMLDEIADIGQRALRAGDSKSLERLHSLVRVTRNRVIRRADPRGRTHMVLATGHVGGTYYPLGRAFAESLTAQGIPTRVEQTRGSVENSKMIHFGYADLALIQSDVALEARSSASDVYDRMALDRLVALCSWYPESVQIMVRQDSSAHTLADLRGKRIVVGAPDSGTRYNALACLEAAEFTEKDYERIIEEPSIVGLSMLDKGEADAVFLTEASPSRLVRGMPGSVSVRLLPLGDSVVDYLINSQRGFVPITIPKGSYPDQKEGVRTVAVTAMLVAPVDMPDERVFDVLRILYDSVPVLIDAHPRGAAISPRRALEGLSIPQHPAAHRFFQQYDV